MGESNDNLGIELAADGGCKIRFIPFDGERKD